MLEMFWTNFLTCAPCRSGLAGERPLHVIPIQIKREQGGERRRGSCGAGKPYPAIPVVDSGDAADLTFRMLSVSLAWEILSLSGAVTSFPVRRKF